MARMIDIYVFTTAFRLSLSACTPYECAGTFDNDFPMYLIICSSLRVPKGVFFVVHTGGHNLARETDYG